MKVERSGTADRTGRASATIEASVRKEPQRPAELAAEVARVLGAMSHGERVRAYRIRAFSPHELAVAAARFPEEMPILNGEFEWIAIDLE